MCVSKEMTMMGLCDFTAVKVSDQAFVFLGLYPAPAFS